MGWVRVGHDWATSLSLFTFMYWRRKWQPTPVFLPGESQGWGSLVGCHLWGLTVRHDWSDLAVVEHSLAFPFFGIGMKTDLFQSCSHCWVFQICWHTECSTFTASSFSIWNSSTGILSPPLALFVVMLSKGHLTSHSRMSGSRWVITPSWLSRSWRSVLYSSSVYSCHLFLICNYLDIIPQARLCGKQRIIN